MTLVVTMSSNRTITAHFSTQPRLEIARCQGALSKEGFKMHVFSELGARIDIQAITHFEGSTTVENTDDWVTVGTVTNLLGWETFLDRTSLNYPQRFYRARLVE
jgi:hypothetical protein